MPFSLSAVFTFGDSGGGNDRPVPLPWQFVLLHPVFRGFVVIHAPLNLRMGNRHDAPQEVREVLVFRAVEIAAHGVMISANQERDNRGLPLGPIVFHRSIWASIAASIFSRS